MPLPRVNCWQSPQNPVLSPVTVTKPSQHPDAHCRIVASCGDGKKSSIEDGLSKEKKDPLVDWLGEFGRYQLIITFFLSLLNIPSTFHIFGPTFLAAQPDDFWCARPQSLSHLSPALWKNISSPLIPSDNPANEPIMDACKTKWTPDLEVTAWANMADLEELLSSRTDVVPCTSWEYDISQTGHTVVTEWNLVCENSWWGQFADTLFLLGVAIGGLTGSLSDRFGRRKMVIASLSMQSTLALLIALVPWFPAFLLLRAMLGFFCVSLVFTGFVLSMELVAGKWLTITGVSYLMPVALAYIFMAGLAYTIPGWRRLQLAVTAPSIIMLSVAWLVPESPRWLIAAGKHEEAAVVLSRAAEFNGRSPNTPLPHNPIKEKGHEDACEQTGSNRISLFGSTRLRYITVFLCMAWFSNYFLYYGLVLNLNNIGGNVYINSLIAGAVELPAMVVSILVLLKMGRKWPICFSLVLSGLACLFAALIPLLSKTGGDSEEDEMWSVAFAMTAKFSVSATNVMLPVFTAELYPTLVRNLAIGVCNIASGSALLFIPYLWEMTWMGQSGPMLILTAWGIGGGLIVLLLPETKEKLADDTAPP